MIENLSPSTASLTPSALQRNWKTPSEFPLCPSAIDSNSLEEYRINLSFGKTFSRNTYGESVVVAAEFSQDGLSLGVISHLRDSPKEWGVSKITIENEKVVHENIKTFFTLQGAVKSHCKLAGIPLDESVDDYA